MNKTSSSESQKAILQGNQNNVVIIGSKITETDPSFLQTIIDTVIANNPAIAKDAVRAIKPAKREDGASMGADKDSEIMISAPAIRAMPSYLPEEDTNEYVEDFKNLEVQIRAIDLDSTKRGWAAILPTLSEKRTKLHLDPAVKPVDMVGKTKVNADVTVIFRIDEKGLRYPALVFLRRISK